MQAVVSPKGLGHHLSQATKKERSQSTLTDEPAEHPTRAAGLSGDEFGTPHEALPSLLLKDGAKGGDVGHARPMTVVAKPI